jgi:hypothetical protein
MTRMRGDFSACYVTGPFFSVLRHRPRPRHSCATRVRMGGSRTDCIGVFHAMSMRCATRAWGQENHQLRRSERPSSLLSGEVESIATSSIAASVTNTSTYPTGVRGAPKCASRRAARAIRLPILAMSRAGACRSARGNGRVSADAVLGRRTAPFNCNTSDSMNMKRSPSNPRCAGVVSGRDDASRSNPATGVKFWERAENRP